MLTEGHRVRGKLELVHSFCCKVHEATEMFVMVDYVREMNVKMSCMMNTD